jgi:hypothetical protein
MFLLPISLSQGIVILRYRLFDVVSATTAVTNNTCSLPLPAAGLVLRPRQEDALFLTAEGSEPLRQCVEIVVQTHECWNQADQNRVFVRLTAH